jgi:long-chain fatty acid transport protein
MSAAMTARSQDLSSIFYNPAGIDYVEKNELFLGLTPIRPSHTYEGDKVSAEAKSKTYLPPQVYIAHRLNSRTVIGAGVFSPFGLGTDWGETWAGRYTSTFAEIQAVYFSPTVSVQVTKWLSFGLGYSWVYSTATIEKMVDSGIQVYKTSKNPAVIANTAYDSKFSLDGEGGGVNWNTGLLLKPSSALQLGVSYRGPTDIKYEGQAKFTHQDFLTAALSPMMPSSQDGTTTLHLPASVNAGLLYRFTEKWDASFDVNYVRWSTYDKLVIKLDKKLPVEKITQTKDWENTTTFRFGTSYIMNELTVLRGGMLYDKSPVPEATFDSQLPDNNRIGFSLGFGRKVGVINLDFSYMRLMFSDRDKENFVGYTDVTDTFPPGASSKPNGVTNAADRDMLKAMHGNVAYPVGDGTYKSNANLFSVSASMKF